MGELSLRTLPRFEIVPNNYADRFAKAVLDGYEMACKEYWTPADEDIDRVKDVRELYESFCSLQALNRWNPPVEDEEDFYHDEYICYMECFSDNFPAYMEDIRRVLNHYHMCHDLFRKIINAPWKQVW